VKAQAEVSEPLEQKRQLLETVTQQDIETRPDGTVAIAQQVVPNRVISTVDAEMRHGRKTTSAKTDGYKSHLLSTNVEADQPRLVTSVVVTPANTADGDV